ncbi:enoyl-CoA hydratase/isomerase family protein [Xanthomonas vesicatoria]|uniref:enoyl-CoA hydratase/isomerase family protein n=1 Tax=Xanthomonas vesicatoria TaxID=56460 RepID=UPI0007320505|nr:enoyl-CoA hydratase-related protein [Xanthomonas vesicatoria]KTF38353.1 enoyl-CoA hydratase [Xanthomonas vesicatoria]MCC8557745.1 enoyl-CoA hydratase-related protein [Xanthomonas vesicatoria]MCC8601643.1 enoyl-CoA hydratase-related protein [Xanthomonas vesicatoria]MCC8611787.1 enoyl-CoA hydratase-related protein [Xanthomonas vesicatoria]MCC8674564.1 enoyl-CoA hydratase-related protein [Xanthomonas vesicatoria]
MSNDVILIADHASVRTITVNRPDKLNALNRNTMLALDQAFLDAANADDVRVVILTGAGPKAFVAGADIAEMSDLSAMDGREFSLVGQRLMRRIERMPKPVLAMVNGFVLGGGLELAMACHLRIAASTARLGQPEINLGLIPGFGGTQRLLRLTGRAAALELCLLGMPIDAARAMQLGLVNRVVEPDALQEETQALAERLANAAPLALRGILDAVVFGGECGIEEGLQLETAQFALLFASDDMREGTRAFLDKRPAQFRNR